MPHTTRVHGCALQDGAMGPLTLQTTYGTMQREDATGQHGRTTWQEDAMGQLVRTMLHDNVYTMAQHDGKT